MTDVPVDPRSGAATSRTHLAVRTTSPVGSSLATSCSDPGAFAVGTVAVAAWSSLRPINHGKPRPIVRLDDVPVNGTYLFGYPTKDDPAILVRLPGDRLHAMSQKCTHLSCVVYYEPEKQHMVCPCHEGVFDARSGKVLEGPPQRPLGRIDVEVRDGTVWALGAEPS